ncbi:Uncharacterised protein [Enterobacter cloacae]|uniref:Uncharacterized protein n=1 Tax=Enterobacter cloacae TaxID=550 RepID=A0A144C1I1_ENTCL|nr:Uncharacterised protein [Enterobacter cloacae]SAF76621.1 Uncharacterised protein [Enterobacter cloacae]
MLKFIFNLKEQIDDMVGVMMQCIFAKIPAVSPETKKGP